MTATITAKTARGAASQIAKAIRRDAVRMMGLTVQEAEDYIFIRTETERYESGWYLPGEHRPTKAERTSYKICWESFAPYEWAILATGGGNIWDEEAGRALYSGQPTLSLPTNTKWIAEPESSCILGIYTQ
jgi:hypothetical protein